METESMVKTVPSTAFLSGTGTDELADGSSMSKLQLPSAILEKSAWLVVPRSVSYTHLFSSVSVVSNALRLRFFTPKWKHEAKEGTAEAPEAIPEELPEAIPEAISEEALWENQISIQSERKGEKAMKKTVKIEGMMCQHCVKAVSYTHLDVYKRQG